MTSCLVLLLVLLIIGLVLWVEGGPHPRTRGPGSFWWAS